MHWSERMKTEIKVGETYKKRDGNITKVIAKRQDKFEVKDINVPKIQDDYLRNYYVSMFGGFGNYPNNHDLVERVL